MAPRDLSVNDVRTTMGRFLTGVAVVSCLDQAGQPHGMTVNSLTSVSLNPPLLLVCLASRSRTSEAVEAAGGFAVSVLSAGQEHLARRFAVPHVEHFDGLSLHLGPNGHPHVPGALAVMDCVTDSITRSGDHLVVFGRMTHLESRPGQPLAFLGGMFGDYQERGSEPLSWFS